jgi:hypothetical protein
METVSLEVEPNRNAEAYRNYQPAGLPVQVEKHIDFIELCDGKYRSRPHICALVVTIFMK